MFILSYPSFANAYRHFAEMPVAELFESMGWRGKQGTSGYTRNGAMLTSLALVALGMPLNGGVRIEEGTLQGGRIFNGANQLARWLREHRGEPEVFSVEQGMADI